jgi:hypothetical protein
MASGLDVWISSSVWWILFLYPAKFGFSVVDNLIFGLYKVESLDSRVLYIILFG